MGNLKGSTIQTQRFEQRQQTSVQQILAAQLTELSVEELYARIASECDMNPFLEYSAPDNDDRWDDVADNDHSSDDTDYDDNQNTDEAGYEGDTYSQDTTMESERDDDFPQAQQGDDSRRGWDSGEELSFHELLLQQVHEYDLTEHQQQILEYLIGSLNDDGFITTPIYQIVDELDIYHGIRTDEKEVEEVLAILQQFDPWGVGARNLLECLLIQVRQNTSLPLRSYIIRMLTEYADELSMSRWEYIQKCMKLTSAEMTIIRNTLKSLNPRPGGSIGSTPSDDNHHVVPDFIVTIDEDNEPHFHLNETNVPIVTLSDDYSAELIDELASEKTKKDIIEAQRFNKKLIDSGRLFIDALAMRRQSMILTMAAILRLQKRFFVEGDLNMLRPMILKDIATLTKLDISTVSRVCRSKTVETPYGVFGLNKFFTSGVRKDNMDLSVNNLLKDIKEIVDGEDKKKPYSDQALTQILQQRGYDIARRTVAKYRIQMNIPDSRLRK